jgi:hypothetical protein
MLVFAVCGFLLHDLLRFAVLGTFSLSTTAAFMFWGAASLLNKRLSHSLAQDRWHPLANVVVNITLLGTGLWLGRVFSRFLLALW